MKRFLTCVCCYSAAVIFGYATIAHGDPVVLKGYFTVRPIDVGPPGPEAFSGAALSSGPALPMFEYTETADATLGGGRFSGFIVGASPLNKVKTTTTLNVQIIPLIITINDGTTTITYDPTVNDACITGGTFTDIAMITGSPIFQNSAWTMNGVNVGTTQYIDAFQRAEFWSLVGGTNYHLILSPTVLPAQTLSFSSGNRKNYANEGSCHTNIGVVDINTLDPAMQNLLKVTLAGTVSPGTFPIFLTHNVVMSNGSVGNCCILGYHSGYTGTGGNLQIYSPFSLDTSGAFGGDVTTLSHEMAEAVNDPTTNNGTPVWGNIGQVSGNQNNFEVGDPLSPGGIGSPSPITVSGAANGLTYHVQELTFFSWFFGHKSLGAGGKYSSNGTFGGFMKLDPPGGTN